MYTPSKNYYFNPNSYEWQKFNGGIVPEGYDCKFFVHCGLMIRKKRETEMKQVSINNNNSNRLV